MGSADDRWGPLGERVCLLLAEGKEVAATSEVLRALGPELCGFLLGVLKDRGDAEEVFSVVSERIWRGLPTFRQECSLRTWAYCIARREIARFRSTKQRRGAGHVPISQLTELIAAITTKAHTTHRSTLRREWLTAFRNELDDEERQLLILRLDRDMAWADIALVFLDDAAACDDERKRESARLRKRFQLLRERLARRARAEGLLQ